MASSWHYPARGRRLRDRSRNVCRQPRTSCRSWRRWWSLATALRGCLAISGARSTASELQQQNRDPYSVLGILQEERVRRAAQIAKDLALDLDSLELGLETEGLANLFRAIDGLHRRLAPLFRKNVI